MAIVYKIRKIGDKELYIRDRYDPQIDEKIPEGCDKELFSNYGGFKLDEYGRTFHSKEALINFITYSLKDSNAFYVTHRSKNNESVIVHEHNILNFNNSLFDKFFKYYEIKEYEIKENGTVSFENDIKETIIDDRIFSMITEEAYNASDFINHNFVTDELIRHFRYQITDKNRTWVGLFVAPKKTDSNGTKDLIKEEIENVIKNTLGFPPRTVSLRKLTPPTFSNEHIVYAIYSNTTYAKFPLLKVLLANIATLFYVCEFNEKKQQYKAQILDDGTPSSL